VKADVSVISPVTASPRASAGSAREKAFNWSIASKRQINLRDNDFIWITSRSASIVYS
jgi:hypothetical protein